MRDINKNISSMSLRYKQVVGVGLAGGFLLLWQN